MKTRMIIALALAHAVLPVAFASDPVPPGWYPIPPGHETKGGVQQSTVAVKFEIPVFEEKATSNSALDEVNAKRKALGQRPLIYDALLTQAAEEAARRRASRHIDGHLPEGDFTCLPAGGRADSAGCAAMEASWGWQSCCWDDPQYTHAGAAVVESGGQRWMHIFVRNEGTSKALPATGSTNPVVYSTNAVVGEGTCSTGSCGASMQSSRPRGLFKWRR